MRYLEWWKHRAALLWTFVKLLDQAKQLEQEVQRIEQKMYDLQFASHLKNFNEQKDLYFNLGYMEGIKWCLNRFKHG